MARLVTTDFSNNAEPCVLRYTTVDNKKIDINADAFDAKIISHEYIDKEGIVIFDQPAKSIGNRAFIYRTSLQSVYIPSTINWIGKNAFWNCCNLSEINLSDCLSIRISDVAFDGCASLKNIVIPCGVLEIGGSAFSECSGELTINSKIIEKNYNSINYPAHPSSGYTDWGGWLNRSDFSKVTIGKDICKIGEYSFFKYEPLVELVTSNQVTSIGQSAFENCKSLKKVTIGDNITKIGNSAFANCINLKIIICKAATPPKLGLYAFSSIPSDAVIIVPKTSENAYINSDWSKCMPYITKPKDIDEECDYDCYNEEEIDSPHNDKYAGTYVHDIAGYSDEEINDVFDGCPDAYWNID